MISPHGRYELNKLASLPMCGFSRSSVGRASHRYRGGHGFESRWSPDFFKLLLSISVNWKINCDDHSSLWVPWLPLNWVSFALFHKKLPKQGRPALRVFWISLWSVISPGPKQSRPAIRKDVNTFHKQCERIPQACIGSSNSQFQRPCGCTKQQLKSTDFYLVLNN